MLADYVYKYLRHRSKRDVNRSNNDFVDVSSNEIPQLPEQHKHAFHGGERALLYSILEDFLSQFGHDGHGCLLRTICEIHSKSVHHFGLFGEFMKLFLT